MNDVTQLLILAITIWATVQPGTGTVSELNRIRDQILEPGAASDPRTRLRCLDWRGIYMALLLYQSSLTAFVFVIMIGILMDKPSGFSYILLLAFGVMGIVNIVVVVFQVKAFKPDRDAIAGVCGKGRP